MYGYAPYDIFKELIQKGIVKPPVRVALCASKSIAWVATAAAIKGLMENDPDFKIVYYEEYESNPSDFSPMKRT
jgi:hypothetical protein